jgi:hypothetical protein
MVRNRPAFGTRTSTRSPALKSTPTCARDYRQQGISPVRTMRPVVRGGRRSPPGWQVLPGRLPVTGIPGAPGRCPEAPRRGCSDCRDRQEAELRQQDGERLGEGVKGHLRKRGERSWAIVIELDRDPATGKRRQKWHTVQGTRKKAEGELARLLNDVATGAGMSSRRR